MMNGLNCDPAVENDVAETATSTCLAVVHQNMEAAKTHDRDQSMVSDHIKNDLIDLNGEDCDKEEHPDDHAKIVHGDHGSDQKLSQPVALQIVDQVIHKVTQDTVHESGKEVLESRQAGTTAVSGCESATTAETLAVHCPDLTDVQQEQESLGKLSEPLQANITHSRDDLSKEDLVHAVYPLTTSQAHEEPNPERDPPAVEVNDQAQSTTAEDNAQTPSNDGTDIPPDVHDISQWTGWAEIENDPEIFTTLLHQWGVPELQVCEIFDIAELLFADPAQVAGLIFLSRYRPDQQPASNTTTSISNVLQPWFADQISKFSCGTVALINVIMNAQLPLGTALDKFSADSQNMTAKQRGILLDDNAILRNAHNSFSTLLDRQIVDVMLKEEVQKHKAQKAVENRSKASKKRKRKPFTATRRKKRKIEGDNEDGNHFVAYLPAHGRVWKVDGMLPKPICCGEIPAGETWLHVAAADINPQMEQSLALNDHCSLMRVTKMQAGSSSGSVEGPRKQEDWAPFITLMLRLHAERGDLQQLVA